MQNRLLILFIFLYLLLCSIVISNKVFAQQKWLRTFGVDVQVASLTNINSNPYGSTYFFDSKSKMSPSPYFLIGRTLGKKFSVHIGVQYQQFSNVTNSHHNISSTNNIHNIEQTKFRYIGIPIEVNYSIWHQNKNKLKLGLSILNNVPIYSQVNYNGSITGAITNDASFAPQPNFFGKLAVQYYYQIKDNKSIGLNIFAANGLNNIYSKIYTGPGSVYYKNSKLFYYGMGLNYQF